MQWNFLKNGAFPNKMRRRCTNVLLALIPAALTQQGRKLVLQHCLNFGIQYFREKSVCFTNQVVSTRAQQLLWCHLSPTWYRCILQKGFSLPFYYFSYISERNSWSHAPFAPYDGPIWRRTDLFNLLCSTPTKKVGDPIRQIFHWSDYF